MRVVFTKGARDDIRSIKDFLSKKYPGIRRTVALRFGETFRRLSEFPRRGQGVEGRQGIRVVFLIRYPYKIYYRIGKDFVEILHVYQTSRNV